MVKKYSTKMRGSLDSEIVNDENYFVHFLEDRNYFRQVDMMRTSSM